MNFFQKLFGGKEETAAEAEPHSETHDFEVLKYDGIRAMKMGQAEYAVKCFLHALQIQDDLEVHDGLATAYLHTEELAKCYDELLVLAKAQPDNQKIFIRMANVAYMMDDYNAMTEACEKALLIDGDVPEVSYLYALACRGQADEVNAVAMATRAIRLNGEYGEAYLLRGETLLSAGRLDEADEDARWLLGHVESNEDVLLLKARIERGRGNIAGARSWYDKVLEADPFSEAAVKEKAELADAVGE
ncbi:hypothetical protein [Prevotella dentasini]|uniref:hypothetical protein n=1 Tax=Prevotella dentasini TaxID=589537 RepID=UPI000469B81E|nr:hypothetical protein [Prevotella dentasini]